MAKRRKPVFRDLRGRFISESEAIRRIRISIARGGRGVDRVIFPKHRTKKSIRRFVARITEGRPKPIESSGDFPPGLRFPTVASVIAVLIFTVAKNNQVFTITQRHLINRLGRRILKAEFTVKLKRAIRISIETIGSSDIIILSLALRWKIQKRKRKRK